MNITIKWLKYLALIPVFLFLIIEGIWLIAIPEGFIKERLLSRIPAGVDMEIKGMKKKFFPSLYIQHLSVRTKDSEIAINEVKASIHYPSLLKGRLMIAVKTEDGRINGLIGSSGNMAMKIKGYNLSEIKNPLLKGDGSINVEYEIVNRKGKIDFSLTNARLEPFNDNGIYIPLNLIDTIKGRLDIDGRDIVIESVNLSGRNIYGRVKGKIKDNRAELAFELMPEKELNSMLMLLIPGSMVSPGYFKIEFKRGL